MLRKIWRKLYAEWLGLILIAPGVAIALSALSWSGLLQSMEWATLDQVIRLRPKEPIDPRITIITIDDEDLKFIRQWPVTDQLLAQAVYNLQSYQPRVIGIDIYRDISVEPGQEALSRAFQEFPNIIGIENVVEPVISASPISEELNQAAPADLILDRDGKVRRAFMVLDQQKAFATKLADIYLKQELEQNKIIPNDLSISLSINKNLENYRHKKSYFRPLVPGDRGYVAAEPKLQGHQVLINYRGNLDRFNTISFQDVIENQVPRELIHDRLIIVGAIAPSETNLYATPYSSRFLTLIEQSPAVAIHANLTSQILSSILDGRVFLQPINRLTYNLILLILAISGALATKLLLRKMPPLARSLLITSTGLIGLFTISWLATFFGYVIPVFSPYLSLIMALFLVGGYESQKQLRKINLELAIANQKLADYSHDLEATVGERTQELSSALKDLQVTQTSLVQAEKMAALGQMVAGIAHEINNPITFISGNVNHAKGYVDDLLKIIQLFNNKYYDEDIELLIQEIDLDYLKRDFYKLLDSMQNGARRVEDIVQSLRTFSRLDEAELKQVDLRQDIESVLFLFKNRITERSDHLTIKLVQDLQRIPLIQCYSAKVNQSIFNLINNAIDAIEENILKGNIAIGEILIQTSVLNDRDISVRIVDNGIGIPANLISKIFDPFFTTKPVGKGTGLGLAIAHSVIVEQHHGSLSCRITEDHRTEFTIILPIIHRLYRHSLSSQI